MDFDSVSRKLLERLELELPAHLTYHNVVHTRRVLKATELLADKEGISGEEKVLLKTAALFHDAGFLETYRDHEEASCRIARDMLPAYGYSENQILSVCRIIMVTKLPQSPATKPGQVICDADLHYIGTDNYFTTAENLYKEFKKLALVNSRKEWDEKQLRFLGNHRFFTPAAREEYGATKDQNLERITKSFHTKEHLYHSVGDFVLMVLGVMLAGFALKGFLVPNQFFDGGVTGLSLLLHELFHINLALLVIALNIPLIIASYFSISKQFAIKTFIAVVLLSLCLLLIPYPVITSDKLLISIFGGVFLGLGTGLTMRAGCALDGIEVLALYTLKRTSFTITEIILGLNIIIFSIAALKFGMETALYSVLTYFAASRMIDYVIEGIQAYTGVTIISGESELIKHKLVNELGRGITVYKGERGFLPGSFEVSHEVDIIFTVVTRLELGKLKNLVYNADPRAFVFANTIKEAAGGIVKRRQGH